MVNSQVDTIVQQKSCTPGDASKAGQSSSKEASLSSRVVRLMHLALPRQQQQLLQPFLRPKDQYQQQQQQQQRNHQQQQ